MSMKGMKMSYSEEKALLHRMLKDLFVSDEDDRAKENKASFTLERIINVANFASRQEDYTARLSGKAYINGIYQRGESKDYVVVSLALLSGRRCVETDGRPEEKSAYESYDCFVYKPRLKKWLAGLALSGVNPLEGLLVSVALVNPQTSADIYEGKPVLNRKAILDSIEII